mmetsp:Transcript_7842/g.10159  ORF Transcript_7842/g.10159 Transcript_7842/m.10159 type:complete len:269 (-) Transcript_7842:80-886(-)
MGCCLSCCQNHDALKSEFAGMIEPSDNISVAGQTDYGTVIDVLVRSFTEPFDPLFLWVVNTDPTISAEELKRRMLLNSKYMLEWVTIPLMKQGFVIMAKNEEGKVVGVTTMRLPGSAISESCCELVHLISTLGAPPCQQWGPLPIQRMNSMGAAKTAEKELLKEYKSQYIYLQGVGTIQEARGKGVGGRMIRLVARLADAKNLPVYLETESESNEKFYMKHGFETLKIIECSPPNDKVKSTSPEEDLTGEKGKMWLMLRKPKQSTEIV